MYEIDANGLTDIQSYHGGTGQSSSRPEPGGMVINQGRGSHNENIQFAGGEGATVTVADANAVPVGGQRPGESVIPAGAGRTTDIPSTTITTTNPDGSTTTSSGGNLSLRTHSPNPGAPAGSHSSTHPTTQADTPVMPQGVPAHLPQRGEFGGGTITGASGQGGEYLMPGQQPGVNGPEFHPMAGSTPQQRADAHMPVTEVAPPIAGSPSGGGAPPPGPSGPPVPPPASAPPVAPSAVPPVTPPVSSAAPVALPTPTPEVSTTPPAGSGGQSGGQPPVPGGGGTSPAPSRILVVGAERPAEFQYARDMASRGRDVTVVNPVATPESAAFAAQGGNFVQAGIETLPPGPGYNVVSEDFPVPIRRVYPQAQAMAAERISRLQPGGHWVVTTESAEFVQMLQLVGAEQGARVTAHEVPRYHEATPDSPHVVEETRFVVTVDRPSAPGSTPPPSQGEPSPTPPPATPPPAATSSGAVLPTTTSPIAPTPTVGTTAAPTATTSETPSTGNTAARVARDAARTPGAPQPGTDDSPTWGTRAHQVGELFLPQVFGGDAPTYARQQQDHRERFTADNQPAEGVERVNPNYPTPPGTPAQIDAMKDEIVNLLAARAQAEQAAQHQSERAAVCEANQGPIEQTVQDTAGGISAVQAHDEAVARHEAVNQEQQQRHTESQGLVAGYPSRAAGLAALSGPLAAWAGFTSLASHLPGEAGAKMQQMNQEAEQMQGSFTQMGAQMAGVDSGAPGREAELTGNEERLTATSEQAASSGEDLQSASEGAAALQEANQAAQAEATDTSLMCTEQAQQHGDAAAEREEQADTLAEQMRAWASAHAQARQQAIAATEQRLQSEGRTIVRRSGQ
jgi:hypothetical protein